MAAENSLASVWFIIQWKYLAGIAIIEQNHFRCRIKSTPKRRAYPLTPSPCDRALHSPGHSQRRALTGALLDHYLNQMGLMSHHLLFCSFAKAHSGLAWSGWPLGRAAPVVIISITQFRKKVYQIFCELSLEWFQGFW